MNEDLHDLVGAHAADALDDTERAAFTAHLAGCADCRAELAAYHEVLGALAGARAVVPPAGLEDMVVARATADAVPDPGIDPAPAAPADGGPGRARRRVGTWFALAAAGAALFAGGVLVGGRGTPPTQVAADPMAGVVEVASAPDAQVVPVEILGARTKVVLSQEMDKAVFLAADLPTPAKGMCYQLWRVTQDGQMVSAGSFLPDAAGHVAAVLEGGAHGVVKLMVTMEPPGGSTHPTGRPVAEVRT